MDSPLLMDSRTDLVSGASAAGWLEDGVPAPVPRLLRTGSGSDLLLLFLLRVDSSFRPAGHAVCPGALLLFTIVPSERTLTSAELKTLRQLDAADVCNAFHRLTSISFVQLLSLYAFLVALMSDGLDLLPLML